MDAANQDGSKDFRSQPGHAADGERDLREAFQWQMAASRPGHGACRRVNLHKGYMGPLVLQFFQPPRVLGNLRQGRSCAINGGKEALDNHRAFAGDQQDIAQDFLQGDRSAVQSAQVILRAPVEFRPNFIRAREKSQSTLDSRLVQCGGVGHNHDFEFRQYAVLAQFDKGRQGLDKMMYMQLTVYRRGKRRERPASVQATKEVPW